MLHLTDIHLDLEYQIGTNADCDLPVCCISLAGPAPDEEHAARYWGGYNCDLPTWTFRSVLEHARDAHPGLDHIMLTGDYPDHAVWQQSREENMATTATVIDLVGLVFPDTQVIPAMGNHETFPCNK